MIVVDSLSAVQGQLAAQRVAFELDALTPTPLPFVSDVVSLDTDTIDIGTCT